MSRPNLFQFATSELSQDAVLCWLAEWAKPEYNDTDPQLHQLGKEFLHLILTKHGQESPQAIESLEIKRQHRKIDILIVLNGTIAICIEDKVGTSEHSGQLERYVVALKEEGFVEDNIVPVYVQTGDQSSYRVVEEAGYSIVRRAELITLLSQSVTSNDSILRDFHDHLSNVEQRVRAYKALQPEEWDWYAWQGFYSEIQFLLKEGNWDDVPNPKGGFVGFWWHWQNVGDSKQYLQLEQPVLCFKIIVDNKEKRREMRSEWSKRILSVAEDSSLKVARPRRFGTGKSMTVAFLEGEYRELTQSGLLDISGTLNVLRQAEVILERAARGAS